MSQSPKKSRKRLPSGFRRCGECNTVRLVQQFRTPHANFGRCIFCWWRRWNSQQVLEESLGLETPKPPDVLISDLGYRTEDDAMRVCATCAGLYELGKSFETAQLCECGRGDQPIWPRYDYNERARLCDCCSTRVLPSGSKWSVWFCASCREYVDQFNEWCGRTIIPIGRHTMMMRQGPNAGRPHDGETTKAFARRLWNVFQDLGTSINLLDEHRRDNLRLQLHEVGLPAGHVKLDAYLEAVTRWDPMSVSIASFERLSSRFIDALLADEFRQEDQT